MKRLGVSLAQLAALAGIVALVFVEWIGGALAILLGSQRGPLWGVLAGCGALVVFGLTLLLIGVWAYTRRQELPRIRRADRRRAEKAVSAGAERYLRDMCKEEQN